VTITGAATTSTRDRILEVAFELFAERGFAGTTVTEIGRRAGLSPGSGSFYRHFRSKEDLLPAAIQHEVARCLSAIAETRASAPRIENPDEARAARLKDVYEYVRRFDPLIRLMLTDGHRVPEVRDAIAAAMQSAGEQLSWEDHPELTVCLTAIGGYHIFSEVQGRAFQGVSLDDFIRVLASMTPDHP
jgi:AcrR family transcriptional regulator